MDNSNHKASRPVSRRVVLGAAGVGVLGAAAGAVGVVNAVTDSPSSSTNASDTQINAGTAANAVTLDDGPIVVHLADPKNGTMDIFSGTAHFQLRDQDLAGRLVKAAR